MNVHGAVGVDWGLSAPVIRGVIFVHIYFHIDKDIHKGKILGMVFPGIFGHKIRLPMHFLTQDPKFSMVLLQWYY